MLIEILRPAGVELGRRWLAALLLAPAEEREAIVDAIERRMAETYGRSHTDVGLDIADPPVQREGYVEQVVRTYERAPDGERGGQSGDEKRRSAG